MKSLYTLLLTYFAGLNVKLGDAIRAAAVGAIVEEPDTGHYTTVVTGADGNVIFTKLRWKPGTFIGMMKQDPAFAPAVANDPGETEGLFVKEDGTYYFVLTQSGATAENVAKLLGYEFDDGTLTVDVANGKVEFLHPLFLSEVPAVIIADPAVSDHDLP